MFFQVDNTLLFAIYVEVVPNNTLMLRETRLMSALQKIHLKR